MGNRSAGQRQLGLGGSCGEVRDLGQQGTGLRNFSPFLQLLSFFPPTLYLSHLHLQRLPPPPPPPGQDVFTLCLNFSRDGELNNLKTLYPQGKLLQKSGV